MLIVLQGKRYIHSQSFCATRFQNLHNCEYRMEKTLAVKKFGEMVLLKHWQKNFGESKACLYVLVHTAWLRKLNNLCS